MSTHKCGCMLCILYRLLWVVPLTYVTQLSAQRHVVLIKNKANRGKIRLHLLLILYENRTVSSLFLFRVCDAEISLQVDDKQDMFGHLFFRFVVVNRDTAM